MQVTTFQLAAPSYRAVGAPAFSQRAAVFRLPLLPAYAMHHSQLALDINPSFDGQYSQPRHELQGDTLIAGSSVWRG